jgi:hypothetical protein
MSRVAGGRRDPRTRRVGSNPRQVHTAAVEFYEEQHVQPAQPDRFDGEEVTRLHPSSLGMQELRPTRPTTPGCRPEPVPTQNGPYRGRRDADAQLAALTHDAHLPPPRVLSGRPQHQVDHFGHQGARTALPGGRVGSAAAHQVPVPTQHRAGVTRKTGHRSRGSSLAKVASTI